MKKFILAAAAMIMTANTIAAELRVLRQPMIGSNRPLLEAVAEVFPAEAAKLGIKNATIVYKDFQVGADGATLMLAGDLDIMVTGANVLGLLLPKVGDEVKLLSGWGQYDYKLVCNDPKIKTAKDITPDTKIAVKSRMAAEHFFVKSIAKRDFGSFDALDKNIQVLPRKQIRSLMESGDKTITCAVPGTPIQDMLIKAGAARNIVQSDNKVTAGIAISSFAMKKWLDKNPVMAEAWIAATKKGLENFNKDPKKYLAKWREVDNIKDPVDTLYQNMKDGNVVFHVTPDATVYYTNLMVDLGVSKTNKRTAEDLLWRPELIK
jgi:ABC-type nitrate/sulfonate/bicarbonate transport system substrate-binding protein